MPDSKSDDVEKPEHDSGNQEETSDLDESSDQDSSLGEIHSNQTRVQNIFDAAAKNDFESVKFFVEKKEVPVSAMDDNDQTAAHIAAKMNNLVILKYLIAQDRKVVHKRDKWDQIVLHQACKSGSLDMVRYLVEQCKSDPLAAKGKLFGDNCIHIAANEGKLDVLKYLLEVRRLDPNVRNSLGEPPMFLAAEKMQLHIVEYLCEHHNADPTQIDNNQRNILYSSAIKGDIAIPEYLLTKRKVHLDINWQDIFGQTILFVATRYNKLNFIQYMVEQKHADMNIADKNGVAPIQEAAIEGHVPIVKYFYEKGSKVPIDGEDKHVLRKLARGKELKAYLDLIAPTTPPVKITKAKKSKAEASNTTTELSPADGEFEDDSFPSDPISDEADADAGVGTEAGVGAEAEAEASEPLEPPSRRRRRQADTRGAVVPNFLALSWLRPHSEEVPGLTAAASRIGESGTSLGLTSISSRGQVLFLLAGVFSRGRDAVGQRESFASPSDIFNNKVDPNAIAAVEAHHEYRN